MFILMKKILKNLNPVEQDEKETMETNDIDQTEFSRLSCQIELSEEIRDITVTMEQPRR